MKQTVILFFAIVVLAIAWSAGWYYVAAKVEEVIANGQSSLFERGQAFDCADQALSGYPFRISLTCNKPEFRDAESGFSIDAGSMRTASQVYQPGKAVMELDGPAILHMPVGEAFDIDWNSLRGSVTADFSGPDRFSMIGKAISFEPRDSRYDALRAGEVQFHGRRVEANDVDFALSSMDVHSQRDHWPNFNLVANVRVMDAFDRLLRKPDILRLAKERGLDGQVSELKYALVDGGEISLSGPYSIERNGVLSGTFEIEAQNLSKLTAALEKALPENRDMIRQIDQVASLLGGGNGGGIIRFTISVSDGNAALGLIPIGRIPPLY